MSEKQNKPQPKTEDKKSQGVGLVKDFFYIRAEDIWAIDSTNPEFVQVYARDQIFKIKPELFKKLEL